MSFSPQLFLSNIKAKDGLAKPNRFKVILPIPKYINTGIATNVLESLANLPTTLGVGLQGLINNATGQKDLEASSSNASISRYLALQCEATELPGRTFLTQDVRIYGPSFKVPYQRQYNDINLTFLCTNDFYERRLFEMWMDKISNPQTNNFTFPNDDATRYTTTIGIIQYDEFVKQIFTANLIDAFPIGIAAQPLSWGDDGVHRLTVQFAYRKYVPSFDTSYNLGEAFSSLLSVYGAKSFDNFFKF